MSDDEAQINDWKAEVSKATGVPADVIRGADLKEIEAHAASLQALIPEPRPAAGYVPAEGRTTSRPPPSPSQEFAAFLNHQLGYTR